MPETQTRPTEFGFGAYVLNSQDGTVTHRGHRVRLQDQPFRLLTLLVEQAGQVVTREEIQARLWPENTYVEFDKSLRVAVNKVREALRDPAERPNYIETVPRRGYRFIAPVVPREPSHKQLSPPASLKNEPDQPFLEAYVPSSSMSNIAHASLPIKISGKLWAVAAVAAGVLIAGILYVAHNRLHQVVARPVSASTTVRRTVAVIGLRNLTNSPQDRWLSTAISEMLAAEMSASDKVRVISGEEVAEAGLAEPPANFPSHDTLVRYAHQLGADVIIYGAYTVTRDPAAHATTQLRLDVSLENPSFDAQPTTLVKVGHTADLFSLVSGAGSELRQLMGISELPQDSLRAVRKTLPEDQTAAQFFALGLGRLRNFDPVGARDLLTKAAKLEPGHAGTHHALAETEQEMGLDDLARSEETQAVKLGVGLPREELLDMQGQFAILSHDWSKAIEIYRTLYTFYPDNAQYCTRLAHAQSAAADSKGALATLNSLQNAGLSRADQAQIELAEINVNLQLGNYPQALAISDRAIQIGEQLELKHVHAQALWMRASALERMGKSEESLAASAKSQVLFREIGDKNGLALAELVSGDVLYDSSRNAEARKNFFDCIDLFRSIGNQSHAAIALERVGNTYFSEGSLPESRSYYEQALKIYREIGVTTMIATAVGNIADVEDVEGNLVESLKNDGEALSIFTKAKDMRGVSTNLINTGHVEFERGNLVAAANDFSRSAEIAHQMSYPLLVANACLGHGDTLLAENDIAGALSQYDLAAKAIKGKDLPDLNAQLQTSRGSAEVMSGNPKQAISGFQQAEEFASKDHDHALAARVLAVLSRAQLELGQLPDAANTANRANSESDSQSGPEVKVLAGIAVARTQIAQGNLSAAQETIRPLLMIAQGGGYLSLAMELRILRARTVLSATERHNQLVALSAEAKTHGWRLLAAEARSTRL